jgi:hypothetical protein
MDHIHINGPLPHAGGQVSVTRSDGSVVTGTYNGTGAGVTVGGKNLLLISIQR